MIYERVNWLNKGETGAKPINKTNLNQMDKGIYDLQNIELIGVEKTAPTECTTGDKYFNTTDKKIYTATADNTWGETGETPLRGILYVVISSQTSYYYNGTTLISIGGGSGGGGDTFPIGAIVPYGSKTTPLNWLPCNGQAVSRTTYADLFAIIGTQFGEGDGSTTFNVPDLNDYKVPIGYDRFEEQSNRMNLGTTGGEETHKLTVEEIPSHTHSSPSISQEVGLQAGNDWNINSMDKTTGSTGGSQPHNNMQPYVTANYIIKAFQSCGVVAQVSNTKSTSTTDTYSCEYVNNQLLNIDKGSVTIETSNNSYVEVAVTFNKTFNTIPTVMLTPDSVGPGFNSPNVGVKRNSVTTTGFTMVYSSNYTAGLTNKVSYLAIE